MTDLRISTMTAISSIHSDIDLNILYQKFTPNEIITYMQYGSNEDKGTTGKVVRKARKPKPKKTFFNQITLHVLCEKSVNVKLFNNGRIQMTGLKYHGHGDKVVSTLVEQLKQLNDDTHPFMSVSCCDIDPVSIACINSDFSLNYPIKRDVLHREIVNAGYYSSYEPCIYPGVNIKYYFNELYPGGICQCRAQCTGKGCGTVDGGCKKVTVAVFQSGKAIITGARSLQQLNTAHSFISTFIQERKQQLTLN